MFYIRQVWVEGFWTHRRKLVMAPDPAPANARKYRGSFSSVERWVARRMMFWISEYDRKREAFSTIAPAKGAGKPWNIAVRHVRRKWEGGANTI